MSPVALADRGLPPDVARGTCYEVSMTVAPRQDSTRSRQPPQGIPRSARSWRAGLAVASASIAAMCALSLAGASASAEVSGGPSQPPKSPAADKSPGQLPAGKQQVPPGKQGLAMKRGLAMKVERQQLENGLRVVLNRDASSPTVAVCVTYDVGARNEQKGRSGFAHLFEHMMFQGSRNVAKGDHFTLIASRGGTMNGTTSSDRTNYFELLPANELELGLWLEADRMKTLAVTQENFENQRKVVQEEYRMRVSDAPYGMGLISLKELAYQGYWPYEHDAIGSMEDLDNAKLEWIREFHRGYYAPNNAVLAISGDFQTDQAMALVRKHFGDARPTDVPKYQPPQMPQQDKPRTKELSDPRARTPGIFWGWTIPPYRSAEHYALELAAVILGYGDSSTLQQELVRESSVAQNVVTWTYDHRGPDLLVIRVLLSESGTVAGVQSKVDAAIARLSSEGPTAEELDKAKQRLQSFFLFGLEGNMSRARQLANYELFWGDARLLNAELPNYFAVTKDQVRAAVQRYLGTNRSNIVVVRPAEANAALPQQRRGTLAQGVSQ